MYEQSPCFLNSANCVWHPAHLKQLIKTIVRWSLCQNPILLNYLDCRIGVYPYSNEVRWPEWIMGKQQMAGSSVKIWVMLSFPSSSHTVRSIITDQVQPFRATLFYNSCRHFSAGYVMRWLREVKKVRAGSFQFLLFWVNAKGYLGSWPLDCLFIYIFFQPYNQHKSIQSSWL